MPRHRSSTAASLDTPVQERAAIPALPATFERRLPGAMAIPVDQIVADPDQPRRNWDDGEAQQRLQELAASIREFGVLQPILVRDAGALPDGRQQYMIIAGERRWRAARTARLESIPALVRDDPALHVRLLQLMENLHDEGLSQLDQARAFQEIMDVEGIKPPELAARLHISAQHVRDCLRVLANQTFADAVERRQIAFSVARKIMQLPDEAIESFRRRVKAGARLQNNDIAVARAQMEAEGVVNPRRKRAAVSQPAPGAGQAHGHDPSQEQALLVPARDTKGPATPDVLVTGRPGVASTAEGRDGASATLAIPEGEKQALLVPDVLAAEIGSLPVTPTLSSEGAAQATGIADNSNAEASHSAADAAAIRAIVAIRGLIDSRERPTQAALADVRVAARDLIAYLEQGL